MDQVKKRKKAKKARVIPGFHLTLGHCCYNAFVDRFDPVSFGAGAFSWDFSKRVFLPCFGSQMSEMLSLQVLAALLQLLCAMPFSAL